MHLHLLPNLGKTIRVIKPTQKQIVGRIVAVEQRLDCPIVYTIEWDDFNEELQTGCLMRERFYIGSVDQDTIRKLAANYPADAIDRADSFQFEEPIPAIDAGEFDREIAIDRVTAMRICDYYNEWDDYGSSYLLVEQIQQFSPLNDLDDEILVDIYNSEIGTKTEYPWEDPDLAVSQREFLETLNSVNPYDPWIEKFRYIFE